MSDIAIQRETTDATIAAARQYRVALENKRVRVLDYHSQPGEKSPLHWHPASLVYVIRPATLLPAGPDGASEEVELQSGELLWREDTTHAVTNVGETDAHFLVAGLKDTQGI
ncbi:MAG: cupin domain-containing protein [Blastocatellia bacterium]